MRYRFTRNCFSGRKGSERNLNPDSKQVQQLERKGLIVPVETKVVEPEQVKKRVRRKKVSDDSAEQRVFEQDSTLREDNGPTDGSD